MPKAAACVACRQDKLRCNASTTSPASCTRCASRNIVCRIDGNYKRVPTRNRMEQLAKELDTLKASLHKQQQHPIDSDAWSNHAVQSQSSASAGVGVSPGSRSEHPSEYPNGSSNQNSLGVNESLYKLEDFVLSRSDAIEAFQEYYLQYHHQLPILDDDADPAAIFEANTILFWTIVFVASKHLPSRQSQYSILNKKLPVLLGNLLVVRHESILTMQALLILTMWPPQIQRQSQDMRWMYSCMTLQMALQGGYHRVGYEHEYYGLSYSRSASDERLHTRLWRFWCFLNALLSCELGLPCLVPPDALEITARDEATLPPDFVSKLRIAMYVSRVNELSDGPSIDGRHWINMARTLERDLKSTVAGLRDSPTQWNSSVDFVYLCVLLNLHSISLRRASSVSPHDPDYAVIQSSAAQAACQMIELFAKSPLPVVGGSPYPQRYCAKYYVQFHAIALLMLPKISALNQISLQQLGEVDDAIRLGHAALMSCSVTRGDEAYRAAAVVEILCKKGVVSSLRGDSPVHSRLGASLWLEQVATAVRWRQQHLNREPRPMNGDAAGPPKESRNRVESNFPILDMFGTPVGSMAHLADTGSLDTAQMVLADLQGNENVAGSFEDWSVYLDAVQANLGAGYDTTWWGGMEMFGS